MDITERKVAEEAIRRSEAYLAEAQRLSHTGSFGWKPDTGEIVWSDEIYRIFEYDRSVKPTIDSSKIGQGARDQQGWRYIGLSKFQIDGIVSVIPTPFTPAEEIDWAALRSLLDFAAGADLSGVCLPAYASEFYKLSEAERREVIVVAVDHLRNKLPVIAQVNYPATLQAVRSVRQAQEDGASAVCCAVPRMFSLDDGALLKHFDRILQAIDIPLIIQDFNPGGSSVSVSLCCGTPPCSSSSPLRKVGRAPDG